VYGNRGGYGGGYGGIPRVVYEEVPSYAPRGYGSYPIRNLPIHKELGNNNNKRQTSRLKFCNVFLFLLGLELVVKSLALQILVESALT